MPKRKLIGTIVSNKMQKTVVVEVERVKEHPRYRRRYKVHKKYKAHDEKGEYKMGDKVIIEECRPISKDKKWKVINKISGKTGGELTRISESPTPEENIKQ
jgi:small subunit ribosomal protein S17